MIFSLFWLILISSIYLDYVKTFFLSSVNKCIIMIIIINVKSLRDLFSTSQGNDSEMRFVAEATQISLKNLKN